MKKIIIGSRGSDLALWQANYTQSLLTDLGVESEIKIIVTKGDRIQDLSFDKIEGKGFFTKEIEEALLKNEIDLAVQSAKALSEQGIKARVVSMPSTSVFDSQDAEYKESVLPASVTKRVAIEAAHVDFWNKYVGLQGATVGMTTFGESAPGGVLLEHFGFTIENVVNTVKSL